MQKKLIFKRDLPLDIKKISSILMGNFQFRLFHNINIRNHSSRAYFKANYFVCEFLPREIYS